MADIRIGGAWPVLPDAVGWVLFALGTLSLTLVWARRVPQRYGRSLIWLTLTGALVLVSSSPIDMVVLAAGLILATMPLLRRSTRSSPAAVWRRRREDPWDQEAALLRLCGGDARVAERLIRYELKRNPQLSRPGAALAAATRLRHER